MTGVTRLQVEGNTIKQSAIGISALILRVALGLIFIPHGFAKVFGADGPGAFASDMPQYGIPAFLGYIAALAEFFGAALLLAGLLTRFNAFLLACVMIAAIVVVHGPEARMVEAHGLMRLMAMVKEIEFPLSLLVIAVALVLLGGRRFSLDQLFNLEDRVLRLAGRRSP